MCAQKISGYPIGAQLEPIILFWFSKKTFASSCERTIHDQTDLKSQIYSAVIIGIQLRLFEKLLL